MADPERTQSATPKRREEMRNKGNVARSREIPSAAVLLGGFAALYFFSGHIVGGLSGIIRDFLTASPARVESVDGLHTLMMDLMLRCGIVLLPVFAITLLCGAAANFAQVGPLFTLVPLTPNLERLNPAAGFSRLFSLPSVEELGKSFIKFSLVGYLAYKIVRREIPTLPAIIERPPAEIIAYMAHISGTLFLQCGAALLVLSFADYAFQRWNYEKSIRMTTQEIRDEMKASEGDPMVKGRIRSIQREKARRRIIQEVPKADVVITNPTHYAVALKYERGAMSAPRVTAKGADLMARRIRTLAAEHNVPVVQRPPLARALYEGVDEGKEIPPDFYKAVAEVLAYVYRLRDRRMTG
ncbi:MAG: flagellar biosynthesis protein FlhB [Deltaproteobacteria bacterium]|nr:flagellar biosynthesis protein FlhB [Deltaproteobacteria bacterium]